MWRAPHPTAYDSKRRVFRIFRAVGPVGNVNVTLTPAVAVLGVIDLTRPTRNVGRNLYESATQKVAEELYDCKRLQARWFISSCSQLATAQGHLDGMNNSKIQKTKTRTNLSAVVALRYPTNIPPSLSSAAT
jgi:hypothetical protein